MIVKRKVIFCETATLQEDVTIPRSLIDGWIVTGSGMQVTLELWLSENAWFRYIKGARSSRTCCIIGGRTTGISEWCQDFLRL